MWLKVPTSGLILNHYLQCVHQVVGITSGLILNHYLQCVHQVVGITLTIVTESVLKSLVASRHFTSAWMSICITTSCMSQ